MRSTENDDLAYILCMSSRVPIEPEDRPFFELVAQVAFCNPFSSQRAELDEQILGGRVDPLTGNPGGQVTESVTRRLLRLAERGVAHLQCYSGKDRDLMQTVFLFEVYHQCCLSSTN